MSNETNTTTDARQRYIVTTEKLELGKYITMGTSRLHTPQGAVGYARGIIREHDDETTIRVTVNDREDGSTLFTEQKGLSY
jgi:hypothetical protein